MAQRNHSDVIDRDTRCTIRMLLRVWAAYRRRDKTGPITNLQGSLSKLQARVFTIEDYQFKPEDLVTLDRIVWGVGYLAPHIREAVLVRYGLITAVEGVRIKDRSRLLGISKSTYQDRLAIAEEEIAFALRLVDAWG